MKRQTRQRDAILKVLANNRIHPTADWIFEEVKQEIPNISKGTVYRNLRNLCEEGAISVLDLPGTVSRFEARTDSHYHFRCEKCGRVCDLDVPVNEEINRRVAERTGFEVSHHQTEFRGICKDCRNDIKERKEK